MANIQSNRWQLSRRQTLKGLGATMALPFLEAMRPLSAQGTSSSDPVRMACLFMPNGVRPDKWTPTGSGKTYKLSPILSPLEALKEEIMVISGLTNKASHGGDGHYFKTASWLTCTTIEKTVGSNVSSNGISIDQVAAQEIGNSTRLPSMELGTEPITSGIDRNVNLTRLYGSHISWKKPDVPLPCEINPRIAFDRLFRNRNKSGSSAAGNPDKSILDIVLDDANSLKRSLGDEDTHKLDQYLESVREIERRIENEASQLGAGQNLTPEALKQLAALSERINKAGGGSKNDFGSLQTTQPDRARSSHDGHYGPRLLDRFDTRLHLHVRQRGLRKELFLPRRSERKSPLDFAPQERQKTARPVPDHQHLAHRAIRLYASAYERDPGRKRDLAR